VVLSRSLDLPEAARLWDQKAAATLVAHGPQAPLATHHGEATAEEGRRRLDRLGVERLELPACEPTALLEALSARGVNQVLWECGPELAASALRQGCVQELAVVIAPKLLGGLAARTPVGELGLVGMDQVLPWREQQRSSLGADLLWRLIQSDPTETTEAGATGSSPAGPPIEGPSITP